MIWNIKEIIETTCMVQRWGKNTGLIPFL